MNANYTCHHGKYCSEEGGVLPCPAGFFCQENSRPVACDYSKIILLSTFEFYYNISELLMNQLLPYRSWSCPMGTSVPFNPCPAGFECDSGVNTLCRINHFCQQGNPKARKCPLMSSCVEGTSDPILYFPYVSSILFVSFVVFLQLCMIFLKRYLTKYHFSQNYIEPKLAGFSFAMNISSITALSIINASVKDTTTKSDWLPEISTHFVANGYNVVLAGSGVGKTIFLDILRSKFKCARSDIQISGRTVLIKDDGNTHIYEATDRHSRLTCGFVPQDDIIFEDLTVEENLICSAYLHLRTQSLYEVKYICKDVICVLGLNSVRHVIAGNISKRLISGGQRKRVNIGLEVVSLPPILIMDEPTSGLDAQSSFHIIKICKQLTTDTGMTIISVLHQPRFDAFMMFDMVLLMNKSGVVFSGDPSRAIAYFSNICSFDFGMADENPADVILDLISDLNMSEIWRDQGIKWMSVHLRKYPNFASIVKKLSNSQPIMERIRKAYAIESEEISITDQISIFIQQSTVKQFHMRLRFLLNPLFICARRVVSISRSTWWIPICLPWIAAFIIGVIQGPVWDLTEFPSNLAIANVVFCVLSTVTFVETFSENKSMMWRETENHVSLFDRFIAYNIVDLIWIFSTPFCFYAPYYATTIPQSPFMGFYVSGVLIAWWSSGMAYFISSFDLHQTWAMMFSVFTSVIFGAFLQGMHPSIASSRHNGVKYLLNLSYNRWILESVIIHEYSYDQNIRANVVFSLLKTFGWCGIDSWSTRDSIDVDNLIWNMNGICASYVHASKLSMLAIGVCLRILSYLHLLNTKTDFMSIYVFRKIINVAISLHSYFK